jgi:proteic killer suppression protein
MVLVKETIQQLFNNYKVWSPLDLAFENIAIRNICEDEKEAERELGSSVSRYLQHRLADFNAAMNINDILVGNPRVCEYSTHDQKEMAIDLHSDYCLIFRANHPQNPLDEMGRVDWTKVRRIKILRIERNTK